MRYEITTDYTDLLILTVNNRVILVSRDINEVTAKITTHYANYLNNVTDSPKPADTTTNNLKVEERNKRERAAKPVKRDNAVSNSGFGLLGSLLDNGQAEKSDITDM